MSLQVWLPLNGDLQNKGLSNAKFSMINNNKGLAITNSGKLNQQCYERITNNTNDYITSDINFIFPGDFSMCCWCKITDVAGESANGIITNHGHETGGAGISIKAIKDSENNYKCYISCSVGFGPSINDGERIFNHYWGTTDLLDSWHHLCLTYCRAKERYRLYVDGKEELAIKFKDAIAARPFRLFDWSTDYSHNGSYKPKCLLNDVRLYDHKLSVREIQDISSGLLLHYKLDTSTINGKVVNDVSYNYLKSTLLQTGQHENTTIHYNNALSLKNNNYMSCQRISDSTTMSASFWIKTRFYPSSNTVVFADYSSSLAFGFYGSDQAILSCAGKASKVALQVSAYYKTNEWNHIVIIKNNNDYNCYINGQLLPLSAEATNEWTHIAENCLYIGCRNNGAPSTFYTGLISDFRLYGAALSDECVKQLYTTPISLSNNYTLFGTQFIEEESATSSFLKTGTIKANEIRDCSEDGNIPATKLQIFKDAIQSTDFIEW